MRVFFSPLILPLPYLLFLSFFFFLFLSFLFFVPFDDIILTPSISNVPSLVDVRSGGKKTKEIFFFPSLRFCFFLIWFFFVSFLFCFDVSIFISPENLTIRFFVPICLFSNTYSFLSRNEFLFEKRMEKEKKGRKKKIDHSFVRTRTFFSSSSSSSSWHYFFSLFLVFLPPTLRIFFACSSLYIFVCCRTRRRALFYFQRMYILPLSRHGLVGLKILTASYNERDLLDEWRRV